MPDNNQNNNQNLFNFTINSNAVAEFVNSTTNAIRDDLELAAKELAIQAHAHIIQEANKDLKGHHLKTFIGDGKNPNVRWEEISPNLFVVEIDESVMFYDKGRSKISMATTQWLLKGKGLKTAKDGSVYKSIPFTRDVSGKSSAATGEQATLNQMAKVAIQKARTPDNKRISMKTIERGPDGRPKIGVLHKIPIAPPFSREQASSLYSKPRSIEDAQRTGLKAHQGIFKLQGLAVGQIEKGGKIKKEAVVFRTVSSKHQGSGEWMYPEIKPGNYLEKAFRFITEEVWPMKLREIKQKYSMT